MAQGKLVDPKKKRPRGGASKASFGIAMTMARLTLLDARFAWRGCEGDREERLGLTIVVS
jgi:hypothetical protein